eukprot:10656663-Ditylum_brightwellii.AAC.1
MSGFSLLASLDPQSRFKLKPYNAQDNALKKMQLWLLSISTLCLYIEKQQNLQPNQRLVTTDE